MASKLIEMASKSIEMASKSNEMASKPIVRGERVIEECNL